LGIASGLPLAMIISVLSVWLFEVGISKTSIGLFALVTTPYTLKFLWSPFVDSVEIPILTKLLGRRRAWILLSQIFLILSIIGLGATNPLTNPFNTALLALSVAFCSATQDIVIDAYRIEYFGKKMRPASAAVIVYGYRVGLLISGAGALLLAEVMSWFMVHLIMASLILIGSFTILLSKEPSGINHEKHRDIKAWFQHSIIAPFHNFTAHNGWVLIMIFIILYKFGDAFIGVMTNPFLLDLGFSKTEIAIVVKTYGLTATLFGAFVGGLMVSYVGVIRSLWIGAILQLLTNGVFIMQAIIGHDTLFLALTIGAENFAGGIGTIAFVAYISNLCHIKYTATQYALLSSLSAIARTWLSSSAGFAADSFGWVYFFIISILVAIPAMLILYKIQSRVDNAYEVPGSVSLLDD
jgi:PAT family beta-lactamase induction signal transducer AmpG